MDKAAMGKQGITIEVHTVDRWFESREEDASLLGIPWNREGIAKCHIHLAGEEILQMA